MCMMSYNSSLTWRVVVTFLVVSPRFVIICILIIWVLIIDNAMAMLMDMITWSGLWGRTWGGQGCAPDSCHLQGWLKCRCHKKTWHFTFRGKRTSMPNRSTTKLLIKHILHHYWQVRDFALNTTFTGGVTALVSAHFLSFFFTQLMILFLFLSLN